MSYVQSQVVLYKMLQAVVLIAPSLLVTVALRRLRVSLPVLFLVTGMRLMPLLIALPNDLGIEGIRANLLLVIVAAALPLAGELVADRLLGMQARRLEEALAITATAITHQVAPDQECKRTFCPEPRRRSHRQKIWRI
jgi:hypothetical protein